ncbi:Copia protein [Bienertia sinuspersici]
MNKSCSHCGKKGHLKDECFELIGYPEWFMKPKGKGMQRSVANAGKLIQEEYVETPLDEEEQQAEIKGKKPDPELVNAIVQQVMKMFSDKQNMGMSAGPSTSNFAGTVNISPEIKLTEVLYLPEFKHNLLSVSKLNENSNIKVIFDSKGCLFQTKFLRSVGKRKKAEWDIFAGHT